MALPKNKKRKRRRQTQTEDTSASPNSHKQWMCPSVHIPARWSPDLNLEEMLDPTPPPIPEGAMLVYTDGACPGNGKRGAKAGAGV